MRADPELPVADQRRAQDAVDELRQALAVVVERLLGERAREDGGEHQGADTQDQGARDEEEPQKREGAFRRRPQALTLGRQ